MVHVNYNWVWQETNLTIYRCISQLVRQYCVVLKIEILREGLEKLKLLLDDGGFCGDHPPQGVVLERGDVTILAVKCLPDFVLEVKSPQWTVEVTVTDEFVCVEKIDNILMAHGHGDGKVSTKCVAPGQDPSSERNLVD